MICTACRQPKHPTAFRTRCRNGKTYRVKQCYDCESAKSNATKRKRRADKNGYLADSDFWFVPRQPWPWPPGAAVFEDVRLRDVR